MNVLSADALPRMAVLADAFDKLASAGQAELSAGWLFYKKIQSYKPLARLLDLLATKENTADNISSLNCIAVLMRTYYSKERLLLSVHGLPPTITQQEVLEISQLLSAHPD